MAKLVADTSALVSLGAVRSIDPSPLEIVCETYGVYVPETVSEELKRTAEFEDVHGEAAASALENADSYVMREAELDGSFPLDQGENAAVSLANELGAELFLCDEFNALPLVHASLTDTRLLTTPTLLRVLFEKDVLERREAVSALDEVADARSWDGNSYVERVRETLRP